MSDLIDRQEALDALERSKKTYFDRQVIIGAMKDIVRNLPSAQPEQRWIPCSERLPEDYEDVLVWYEYFRYSGYNRIAQTWDVGYYNSQLNIWGGGVTGQKVRAIAWMPLPEPYREVDK